MTLRRVLTLLSSVLLGIAIVTTTTVSVGSGALTTTDTWHLDRINQQTLPLDGNSLPSASLTGAGIDIYIVDTGINYAHEQFGGRAVYGVDIARTSSGSIVDPRGSDCDGHGTHVASLAAGETVGVARGSRIISVRVLDCNGLGEVKDVVAGLNWIADHHKAGRLAIANLSLGVDLGDDGGPIDAAVRRLVADGVIVAVAAGNGDRSGKAIDACLVSPGDEPEALTVGATTVDDVLSSFSNIGPCIDVFAPGGSRQRPLVGASHLSPTSYSNEIGTSMASPLAGGYAALLAQQQPALCPVQIHDAIVERATPNVISGLDPSSPNRLLFLNTEPVTSVVKAGQPNNLLVSAHDRALKVSWDRPCNGGSPFTKFVVSVYRDGKLIKKKTVGPRTRMTTIIGLRNSLAYRVSVRPYTEFGITKPSSRVSSPTLRVLRVGQTVATTRLLRAQQGKDPKWTVAASSRSVCAVIRKPQRLVAKSRGACKVRITPLHAASSVFHTFTVK